MKVLIVDDEQHNREGLRLILNKKFPEINIVGEVANAGEARKVLSEHKVDVLLLDIQMPKENGFDLLNSLEDRNFLTVFITAHAEHAIRAFKSNAVDYILKPIDEDELALAIQKCKSKLDLMNRSEESGIIYKQAINQAINNASNNEYPQKLTLTHSNGFQIVSVDNITHLLADGNYTHIYFSNENPLLTSKPIKEFEEILDPKLFFRIHKSTMINIHYLKNYSSAEGHEVLLTNGVKLSISRRRLDDFMNLLASLSRRL